MLLGIHAAGTKQRRARISHERTTLGFARLPISKRHRCNVTVHRRRARRGSGRSWLVLIWDKAQRHADVVFYFRSIGHVKPSTIDPIAIDGVGRRRFLYPFPLTSTSFLAFFTHLP